MYKRTFLFLIIAISTGYVLLLHSGCAQVGAPTGGPNDTIPPQLVKATPENGKLNFTGNRITLTFNEYIEVKDLQSNLLVSPLPKSNPTVINNLKTVNIKFRDTLKPNTTYSLDFGNAIVDVNESNVLRNFTYTFSTGNYLDSMELRGKVLLAETGQVDSSLQVLLYRDSPDTAVLSRKPDYATRVNGAGNFIFRNLPVANFRLYALKDGDGSKSYNSKTEGFAFYDSEISTSANPPPVTLFAYAEEKAAPTQTTTAGQKKPAEKKLQFNTSIINKQQDILQPLELTFTNGLRTFDPAKIILADTNYRAIPGVSPVLDSSRKKATFAVKWEPETQYKLFIAADAAEDSSGNALAKSDTINFNTKRLTDYGSVVLRFRNFDLSKHPRIQFLQVETIKFSYPLTGPEWSNKVFPPGEYDVRILYDTNENGQWDPGNYKLKLQPERAITLPQKLSIRADWDNEREIQL